MKEIYVDGSCRKNPGPGSWAAIVVEDGIVIDAIQSDIVPDTTNNRMEMSAILWAKEKYGSAWRNIPTVYTDSAYALNSFTVWLPNWKRNGWTKYDGGQIENIDLVKLYDKLDSIGFQAIIKKVSGHSGHKWNELADQLATRKITSEEILNKYGR